VEPSVLRLIAAMTVAIGAIAAQPGGEMASRAAALADSTAAFACDLFRAAASPSANLVLSPHSIGSAFAMARAGASGETAKQMDAVLHLSGNAAESYRLLERALADVPIAQEWAEGQVHEVPAYSLAVANALFSQSGWSYRDSFRRTLTDDFGAHFGELDFAKPEEARTAINRWVEEKTRERIQNLVPAGILSPLTRMVLASAIYFKAPWAKPFPTGLTTDASFFVDSGHQVTAPRMKQTSAFRYAETPDAQIVGLPYRGGKASMVVVLPRTKDGLGALVGSLSRETLRGWTRGLRERQVALELPRFTFTFPLDLVEVLQGLGMTAAFDPRSADFTGMTDEKPFYISAALHKAFVAVDEKGTEAAAATAIAMSRSAIAPPSEEPVPFVADHPFLFFIRHEQTGEILFLGQVVDPTMK
jgi:serine protease inhibitor